MSLEFCKCGKSRQADWRFCPYCGLSLKEQEVRLPKYSRDQREARKMYAYALWKSGLSYAEVAKRIPALGSDRSLSVSGVKNLIRSGERLARWREWNN